MENLEVKHRDIDVITSEIKELCDAAGKTMLLYAAEIGRRLVEAKEILPHGEWGRWLSEECGFSQRTANKQKELENEWLEYVKGVSNGKLRSKAS